MAEPVIINLRHVARGLGVPLGQVQAVVELLDDGNTVPFITRYRKDQTGGLDEEQIRQIQTRLTKLRLLAERKQTILRSIESQGKLTERLAKQIHAAGTTKRLEDLYLPYRPKKQTLASLAHARGLEPLANEILAAEKGCADLDSRAADFVNPDRGVPTAADALLGAGHILAEQYSERAELRQRLREILYRGGRLVSVKIGGEAKTAAAERGKGESGRGKTDVPLQPSPVHLPPSPFAREAHPASESPADAEPTRETQVRAEDPAEPHAEDDPPDQGQAEKEPEGRRPDEVQPPAEAQAESGRGEAEGGSPKAQGPLHPSPVPLPPSPLAPEVRPQAARSQRAPGRKDAKKKKAEERLRKAFADYFDYREEIKKIPPHRVLAINRGERAKVLRVRVEDDLEAMYQALDEFCVPHGHPHAEFLRGCARDALARLILPSLEREVRRDLTERAEVHAVGVFARNLRNLLLQPPVRGRRLLAVDPGYRSGCKLVALDQFGNVLAHGVIYLVGKPERRQEAQRIVAELIDHFQLTVVAIGNGTACREAEGFFAALLADELKDRGVSYAIVNEAGASVYSTSRLGREEFPDYDASLRGAISIGRRLQDPLSELVKIEPANIGVGLYQHDVKAKHLQASLDEVIESCVNYVGVDVNTASPALLRYVSGLNQLTARRIYDYRLQIGPIRNREQLREVPGFGEATFVQAAGFLKITTGDHPLDATWIHPESYAVATRVMDHLGCTPADLARKESADGLAERIKTVDVPRLAKDLCVGELLLRDILAQLARPGRDPREDLPGPVFKQGILKLEDLTPGMELTGTVLNVVDFGAFVDIGMHDSGLVHVSQLADRFVRDPHDVIAVGDIVRIWVLEVDRQRRRVSLTMIPPGAKRAGPRRERKPAEARPPDRAAQGRPEGKPRPPFPKTPRPKAKGPFAQRPKHKPKSRPKPVIPITREMITGKEPMRSFSDLAQFFQTKGVNPVKDGKRQPRPREEKRPPAAQSPAPSPQSPAVTPTSDHERPLAEAEIPKQPTHEAHDEAKPASDGCQESPAAPQLADGQPASTDAAALTPSQAPPSPPPTDLGPGDAAENTQL